MNSPRKTKKSSPRSPQLERACAQQRTPKASKNKERKKFTKKKKKKTDGDFSGGPAVKISPSSAGGAGSGSIPGQGAKIPHASQTRNQNIKQKQYCNKFNKDLKKKHRERHYQK